MIINFKNILYAFVLVPIGLISGCSKNNGDQNIEEIRVKSINAVIPKNIDITNRNASEWWLSLSNYKYDYQIKDSVLSGTAVEGGYSFDAPFSLILAPKDWRTGSGEPPLIKSLPLSTPVIKNQSQKDSLVWSDMLYASYQGEHSTDIAGLRFLHANALLDFELVGFPENTTVKATPLMPIEYAPYQYAKNKYQFITLGEWWKPSTDTRQAIFVHIGDDEYTIEIEMNKTNTCYRFNLRFDNTKKTIAIEDLKESVWTNEKWPNH